MLAYDFDIVNVYIITEDFFYNFESPACFDVFHFLNSDYIKHLYIIAITN